MVRRSSGGRANRSAATKNMVLRLDPALADRLRLVAEVEGRSISDVAREAVAALVERRRRDKRFQTLLDENLSRHAEAMRLLRDDTDGDAGDADGAGLPHEAGGGAA